MISFAVVITALDETWSLRETVERIVADNPKDVTDILIVIAPHTTPACRAVIGELEAAHPGLLRCHEQARLPGVGGALRESVALIDADWVVIMSADLETPPQNVKDLVARAKAGDAAGDVDIVATSRWIAGGDFGEYPRWKVTCNWIFQKFFAFLFGTALTDLTYGYRAVRADILRRHRWSETGMAFFMEMLVKPLRCGARAVEIPVRWQPRREGQSHCRPIEYLRYFRLGFAARLAPKSSLLRGPE